METKRMFSALMCILFVFCSAFTTSRIFNIRANAQTEDNSSIQNICNISANKDMLALRTNGRLGGDTA